MNYRKFLIAALLVMSFAVQAKDITVTRLTCEMREGRVKASAGCNSSTSVRRDENTDGMALSGIGGETDLPVGYPN